ncbi:hypothetical protein ACIGCZ_37315 [Streptomyces nigra]|uniref:hypothetical protein n=1 Tax=Streptomyces nigra TaxID=1827580 RepID=UPI0037D42326
MGYRPKRRVYALDFTGTDWEGLEVSMRGMTVGEELDLAGNDISAALIVEELTKRLISWNVEDEEGRPVPTTMDGVRTQDGAMILAILDALRQANSGVPAPLPETSPSGETSPAPPIPMAPLSQSPENSAVPA